MRVHVQVTAKHVHRGVPLPSAHPRGHEPVVKVQSLEPDCLGSNPGPASYQHTLSYCCLLHGFLLCETEQQPLAHEAMRVECREQGPHIRIAP